MSADHTGSDTSDADRRAGPQRQPTGYEAGLLGREILRFI